MKQYLLSVHSTGDEVEMPEAEMQAVFAAVDVYNEQLRASGAWVFAGGLFPADTASVVRVDGGKTVTTDGPFTESKEHLGGFWIVKAPDLDAALKLAEGGARACRAAVEVRPFQDDAED